MRPFLHRNRWLLEPAVGAAFLAFWAVSEAGRHPLVPGMMRAMVPYWGAILLLSVAMGLARIQPIAAMSLGTAALIGQLLAPSAIFDPPQIYLGYAFVVVVVSASVRGRMRVAALVFGVGAGLSIAGLLSWRLAIGHTDSAIRVLFFALLVAGGVVAWLIGTLVGVWGRKREGERELARATEELREVTTETIVAGERERIAQDVHDIMAHSLSVILAQADGARSLAEARPEELSRSLAAIAGSARTSLTEVRMLIEGLVSDPSGAEAPSLADLDPLVERMRAAGLPVTVERYAEPEGLTATQELAVYRIVQEALTNALKHGGDGTAARVVLDARGGGMMLSVSSSCAGDPDAGGTGAAGTGAGPSAGPGGGRGLHSMRERARLAGGWLDAGEDDDAPGGGGYLVTAFIPAAGVVAA